MPRPTSSPADRSADAPGRLPLAVLGCGRSGAAAARLARRIGEHPVVLDTGAGADLEGRAAAVRAAGVEVIAGGEALAVDPRRFGLAVASPGIGPGSPLVRRFEEAGIPVIAEIEFAWRHVDAPVVAVTGTNGKTTTTELTAAVLAAGGARAVACGNYGIALSDVLADGGGGTVYVVEVSSFQLERIDRFRPDVAVWLNFAPDHLDHHPDVESYRAAKLRIFENQGPGDTAVVRAGESLPALAARTLTFSAAGAEADFRLEGTGIVFRDQPVVDLAGARLRGRHNAENAMAALAVAHARGMSLAAVAETVRTYAPPPHRCELVATAGGIEFVNDSKATNLHALESALRSIDRPVVLVAGGKDKGLDYRPLRDLVRRRATAVVTIGEIAATLGEAWGDVVRCRRAADLGEAVALAARLARPGQTVLFSPGTSSFDMFSGFEERGDAFRQAVNHYLNP